MFFTQFKALCDKMNTTPTAVIRELGYSTSKVTYWKNGSIPSLEIASKIAKYFNVSTDYLLTGEEKSGNILFGDVKSNNGSIGVNNATATITVNNGQNSTRELSKEELELVKIYNSLDVKSRLKMLNLAFELEEKKE